MVDIKIYQSNINSESPESQAKKKAIEEAFIPEDLKVLIFQSATTSSKTTEDPNSSNSSPNRS